MKKVWSNKGIALYPPDFPMVGQNRIFNALYKFKQHLSEGDISGFFVVIGDWGLGKTRLGYELFGETANHVEEWLLNENEYVVPNAGKRILKPQLAEGILPLFIDYKSVIDEDLAADTWVPKVTCNALSLLWDMPNDLRVSKDLIEDIKAALKAKGVDLSNVRDAIESRTDWKEKLDAANAVLQDGGIKSIWVVVDEVETPGDLKKNPDYAPGTEIAEEDLLIISQVIKEARYREDHSYANFLLLCSLGMSDSINIGPNKRRGDLVPLEPNHISDVTIFCDYLNKSGYSVDYPQGTVEGAFLATNRNFGWFNKMMSSIHTSWESHKNKGAKLPPSWKLIEEYAKAEARGNEIFDLSILKTLTGLPEDIQGQLIFGQLPVEISPDIDPAVTDKLISANVPGIGPAFARLFQVHMDEATLANEIVKPEYGFKKTERPGDEYYNPYAEFSVTGVLSALRAFSVDLEEIGDFLVYEDTEQFVEQLSTLYSHKTTDSNKDIERAAETLHNIFKMFSIQDKEFIAVSFKLLKKINVRMSLETRTISFFRDPKKEEDIDLYAANLTGSAKKRMDAVCKGMAKVIDDTDTTLTQHKSINNIRNFFFESEFNSPPFKELSVTGNGKMTIAFCDQVSTAVNELSAMLGRATETVHPVLVLFNPDGDIDGFKKKIRHQPLLERAVILRKLRTFEQEFLIKYSGRDSVFDTTSPLSSHTHAILGALREDLSSLFKDWRNNLEENGYVLRPLWYSNISGREDFYRGYRYLLTTGQSADAISQEIDTSIFFNDPVAYSNFINACKKNTSPGKVSSAGCLPIMTTEPFKPEITQPAVKILQEMKLQIGEKTLAKRFFFAARDKEVKGKQITQVIDFLKGLGIIVSPAQNQFKAISQSDLDSKRSKAANWLNNIAMDLVEEIKDTFPTQAKALKSAYRKEAEKEIAKAEKICSGIDFSFLNDEQPDIQAFSKLVKDVYEFEQKISGVCPDDPNVDFVFSENDIVRYQEQYKSLPFWNKLYFLRWLKSEYAKKRTSILKNIDEQLADAQDYAAINGKPFPIAPLTLPLKSINHELERALSGQSFTSRDLVELEEYQFSIADYLMKEDYETAWKRLNLLDCMTSKTASESIWQKFLKLHEQWQKAVSQFSDAETGWKELNKFMSDAPVSIWPDGIAGAGEMMSAYESLEDQVEGGLDNDIKSMISSHNGLSLIEKLSEEIIASVPKYQGFPKKIADLLQNIKNDLLAVIDDIRLQALNNLLRSIGNGEWHEPKSRECYGKTKTEYETFNNKVSDKGKELLEGMGKRTNWELWVEIYTDLSSGKYTKNADHEACFDELEQIGLIERTVRLK
ncbi:Uncharacterized protein dnl_06390 [Desulfonema limicola]|uniref:Uncharacterized protein n=1 Tax=Desulfonema limicola TaxID=45656 RepID=A0A975GEQ0_9BACT|nr:hypothetical protein [Desulfonema limicola]QTA78418.1 Uncharacterized protein dnl_06390 [Desulfonema limicola]